MISQQKRLSKKERKVVAFRARKGKGKPGEDEILEVPIIDMVRDGEDEVSTQTTHQPRKHSDEKPVNKKRKRDAAEDANAIATEETPKPKKQKRGVTGAGAGAGVGEQTNLAKTKVEESNSSKYILFVGMYNSYAVCGVIYMYQLTNSTQETLVIRLLRRRLSSIFLNAVSPYHRLYWSCSCGRTKHRQWILTLPLVQTLHQRCGNSPSVCGIRPQQPPRRSQEDAHF